MVYIYHAHCTRYYGMFRNIVKTMENLSRIKILFGRLKDLHSYYVKGDNDQKMRLLDLSEPLLKELKTLGVSLDASRGLLIWGREFLIAATLEEAARLFGGKVEYMTFGDKEFVKQMEEKGQVSAVKESTFGQEPTFGLPVGKTGT